jgi:DNA-binding transcriptional LysR family regulator
LEVVVEVHEPLVLIVAPDHWLANRSDGVALGALSDESFVLDRPDSHTALHAAVNHACSTAGFLPKVACEGAELLTIGRLVASGVGVALVPQSMANLIGGVHQRSIRSPTPHSSVAVVVGRPRRLNPASDRFLASLCAVAWRVIGGVEKPADVRSKLAMQRARRQSAATP